MTHVSVAAGAKLTARSEPLADLGDLLDHLAPGGFAWLDGDCGFVTAGVAAIVMPDAAESMLAGLAREVGADTPAAAGPRAVGALPFQGIGRMVVPARIVARDTDGQAWSTTITAAEAPGPLRVARRQPTRFDVHAASSRDDWDSAVHQALALIDSGALAKVVLARAVDVHADCPFDRRAILDYLRTAQRGSRVYADGGFIGASPELLVTRHGARVEARPLAGTGTQPEQLLASTKDAWEHQVVVDAVAAQLATVCTDLDIVGPEALRFADITHLATTITARAGDASALALAQMLHPTPAVGGRPTELALHTINRLERFDRGRYAGPCGWVDAHGDGEFVVALRGAEIDGAAARLVAGAGIVAGSDPAAEWTETQAKLEPILRALIRP
ncbi:MAG: isochorismate synthase [Actinomycetota bacterium]|nr:isochorismate synthase [Actinomycetota bacterium]